MVTKRVVVGAHYGFRSWLAQRVTAVVIIVYTLLFLWVVWRQPAMNFEAWRGIFSGGFMRYATFAFFVSVFYHAWVGVRDIFMDYIKPTGLRLTLHSLVVLALVAYTGWAAQILWRL